MPEPLPLTHDKIELPHSADDAPMELPPAVEEMGVLNDEVLIENPPERPCGTIRVTLVYDGRSTPIAADDPVISRA